MGIPGLAGRYRSIVVARMGAVILGRLGMAGVPFVRLAAVRGRRSCIPPGVGGKDTLHLGGGLLRLCRVVADSGRLVGHYPVVGSHGFHALPRMEGQVVLVVGVRRYRQRVYEPFPFDLK